MDSTVLIAIVMSASAVLAAAVTGMYAYRASRKNSEQTRAIEQDKLSTDSWDRQVKAWREDVVALRTQRAEDLRTFEAYKAECTSQVEKLTRQIKDLQRQRDEDEERHRRERQALIAWVRAVVPIFRESGIPFPPLPPGVLDLDA
jgi:hypothetical protein